MKWARIATKAKDLIDQRGGTDALKQDAEELRRIAREPGSMSDKAKKAANALKDPHAGGGSGAPGRSANTSPGEGSSRSAERSSSAENDAARRGGREA